MKKKRWLFFALIFAFMFSHVAFSEYLVSNPLYEGQVNEDPEEGQHKVTFIGEDGQIKKTMYVDDGYTLRLRDAPYYASGSEYSRWTSNVLNNRVINDHIEVTSDMGNIEFRETTEAPRDVSATYNEDLSTSATSNEASILKNQVSITDYGISGTITCNISARIKSKRSGISRVYYYENDTHLKPTENGEEEGINIRTDGGGKDGTIAIGDFSIGLESTGEPTNAYKPNTGGTSFGGANNQDNGDFNKYSTNYCVTKITLQTDVVLMGGITLGAMTGYYGANATFSQYNFQGFIIGSYSELDLNGYDFVMEDLSKLDAWGSVTDSSRYNTNGSYNENLSDDKKGHLILRSGSTLWTCFVIEDYYRPDSVVTAYTNGSACFTMYRTPYIDCDTYLYPGCNYYGKLRIDFAGSGKNGIGGDIKLFGDSGLISFSSKSNVNGYIVRSVSYDKTLLNDRTTYWRAIKNIQHQKITYILYNVDAKMNSFSFDINYVIVFGSEAKIAFSSLRSPFFVSPYYHFYFYNTEFTLAQQLFFMPGTYVYFDANSILKMTWGISNKTNYSFSGLAAMIADNVVPSYSGERNQEYQPVAGITFLPAIYPRLSVSRPDSSKNHYIDVSDSHGQEISDYASSNNKNYWDYVNSLEASCDFYGTIEFVSGSGVQNHPICFGGKINIYNMTLFETSIEEAKSSIQIDLISNNILVGPSFCKTSSSVKAGGMNCLYVSNFFVTPLISKGFVVADIASQTKIDDSSHPNSFTSDKIVWDSLNNVYTNQSKNQSFAFFYNNNNATNLYKAERFSFTNNLDGQFKQIYLTETNRVYSTSSISNDNSQNYICFNGMMVHVNASLQGTLPKFCGSNVDYDVDENTRNGNTNYQFSILSNSDFWGATIA